MTVDPSVSDWNPVMGGFGLFGGRYASELLREVLVELDRGWREIVPSEEFQQQLKAELQDYAGRPTAVTFVPRFSQECDLEVWLKREDLLHGGAHKTNNVVGQGLLARHLGKQRIIAETGAGQHGVATAMIGARLGLETVVYMGTVDMQRQMPNVKLMRLCGAEVVPVDKGAKTLKEAINEAMRGLDPQCGLHALPPGNRLWSTPLSIARARFPKGDR